MRGNPQDFMKVGIIHFMAFPKVMGGEGPILDTLRELCEDDYFQVVEVTQIKDPALRKQAAALAKSEGVTLAFGAQPILLMGKLNLNSADEAARQKAVEAVKGAIAQAYELNASGVAVLSGPDPVNGEREKGRGLIVQSLRELCAFSKSKGDKPVVLETFDRKPFGKNCLIGPTTEAVKVAEVVCKDFPSFGLMLDLSHLPLLDETPRAALTTAKPFLRHIHIGNCVMRDPKHPAYGDNHPMFGIEGGENDVDELVEFLRVLLDIGYIGEHKRNVVSFELKPYGDQTSDDVIENGKETLEAAWRKL
ncbi:MAG: TIM barrel protein [Planctomycetes bacterium]|nr:TIM barrel protein [Planctomycetota bacterium]